MPPPGIQSPLPLAVHVFRRPLPYAQTLRLQDAIFALRSAARKTEPEGELARRDVLLLLEHRPTFTSGRRDSTQASLDRVEREASRLARAGADWAVTRRGGQATYHGPGQVVGYLVADLGQMKLSTKCYVDKVQRVLKRFIESSIGRPVLAPHPDDHVGVFPTVDTKIASIGIHIRQRLTTHGFALNLTAEPLRWFAHITACGLPSIRATALSEFHLPAAKIGTSSSSSGLNSSSAATMHAAEEHAAVSVSSSVSPVGIRSTGDSETAYAEATALLADRFGAEFGQASVWEPLDLDSPVGRLVSELEAESAQDGEAWLAEPKLDDEAEPMR